MGTYPLVGERSGGFPPPISAADDTHGPKTSTTMVGLEEIEVYIARRQNTAAQYIANRPIMELCLAPERKPWLHLSRRWWDHPALDILVIRAGHAAAEEG